MSAFVNTNVYLTGSKPVPFPSGSENVSYRATLAMTTADLDSGDYGPIAILPAGCVPVDIIIDMTDPDTSTAALIFDVGVLAAAATTLSTDAADGGAKWGSNTAVTAASSQRLTRYLNAIDVVTATSADRRIGLVVATPPTTAQACTVGLTLIYRAA